MISSMFVVLECNYSSVMTLHSIRHGKHLLKQPHENQDAYR